MNWRSTCKLKDLGASLLLRSAWRDDARLLQHKQRFLRKVTTMVMREVGRPANENVDFIRKNDVASEAAHLKEPQRDGVVAKDSSSESVDQNRTPPPLKQALSARKGSVDVKETAKFEAMAHSWWDYEGSYKPLHLMNPVRLCFIRSALCRRYKRDMNSPRPLEGLSIVDVGCGGGLLCEPLARMGAKITGIDAVEQNIIVASLHAAKDPLTSSIGYSCSTAEQLVQDQQQFDVVTALEVIEHVADPREFCSSLSSLVKPDGIVFISTINRSITAFGAAIVGAEYILSWLPKETHNWFKLVTPEELALIANHASLEVQEMAGMVYNPLVGTWSLSDDLSVNYIACMAKIRTSKEEEDYINVSWAPKGA